MPTSIAGLRPTLSTTPPDARESSSSATAGVEITTPVALAGRPSSGTVQRQRGQARADADEEDRLGRQQEDEWLADAVGHAVGADLLLARGAGKYRRGPARNSSGFWRESRGAAAPPRIAALALRIGSRSAVGRNEEQDGKAHRQPPRDLELGATELARPQRSPRAQRRVRARSSRCRSSDGRALLRAARRRVRSAPERLQQLLQEGVEKDLKIAALQEQCEELLDAQLLAQRDADFGVGRRWRPCRLKRCRLCARRMRSCGSGCATRSTSSRRCARPARTRRRAWRRGSRRRRFARASAKRPRAPSAAHRSR